MKRFFEKSWVIFLLRLGIGGLFVYAGWIKMQNPQAFADSIYSFHLMPSVFINLLALTLPPFEIMAGALMIVGWQMRPATLAVVLMNAVFILAIAQGLARGLKIDCGCFGSGEPTLWKSWAALGRDILLLAGAWLVYLRNLLGKNP